MTAATPTRPRCAATCNVCPPACIVAADFDPLRDEGVAYARALEGAGVPVRLARARGHTHTSVTMVGVVISGAPVRAEIGEALRDFFPSAESQLPC